MEKIKWLFLSFILRKYFGFKYVELSDGTFRKNVITFSLSGTHFLVSITIHENEKITYEKIIRLLVSDIDNEIDYKIAEANAGREW